LNIRGVLAAALAAATVTAAAITAPAAAEAAARTQVSQVSQVSHRPAVRTVDLHAQFEKLRGRKTTSPRAGIVPPLHTKAFARAINDRALAVGHRALSSAGQPSPIRSLGCKEPDCVMPWNGGSVQHNPKLYVVFWGPTWTTDAGEQASSTYLLNFYSGLGTSSDTWSLTNSQYSDGTGSPAFSGSELVADTVDTGAPPTSVSQGSLAAEAAAAASFFSITDVANAQVVVVSQSGTCFNDGFAGSSCTPVPAAYCAWHSATAYHSGQLSYTNLPYQLDAGGNCGEDWINPGGTWDGFSTVGGHEYAEAITDPVPNSGYIDLSDNVSGGEIGDKCAWAGSIWGDTDPAGNITLSTGTFAVQSLWSNSNDGCVMSGPVTPTVKVTTPGTQTSSLGSTPSLQIKATATPAVTLTYAAAGLPSGLSINSATGLIHGKVGGSVRSYTPKVTVRYTGGSKSVSFKWQADAVGAMKGYASLCADDHSGKTTAGNKIDIWSCTGGPSQRITYTTAGQLRVLGGCFNAGSVNVFYEPCTSATNKVWTRNSSGEYVVKSSGKCLTDPNNAKAKGTQLTVSACKNAADQHWTLP